MEQFTKILTSNFTSNALVTAFVVVGIVCWVAAWLSTHVFRGKIHSSAIAIAAGLLLAWLGGELTGGKKGLSDITLFSGIALMGGGMFRDFAIIATAFGVKLEELKKRASRARWRWSSLPCSPSTWERLLPGPSAIPMRSAWRLSAAAQ